MAMAEDPAGDAYLHNTYWALSSIPCPYTYVVPGSPDSCTERERAVNTVVQASPVPVHEQRQGVVPAHPARDLLGLRMQETPETLEVFLDVAQLNDDFTGSHDGANGTFYVVEWIDPVSECFVSLHFDVVTMHNGLGADTWMATSCSDVYAAGSDPPGPCHFRVCYWKAPLEVDFGSPASLHWTILRRDLAASGPGPAAESPFAYTGVMPHDWGLVMVSGAVAMAYRTPDRPNYVVDLMDPKGASFTFTGEPNEVARPGLPAHLASVIVSGPTVPPRPELRFLAADFEEVDGSFRMTATMANVSEVPENHTFGAQFGIPGFDIILGYSAADGIRNQFASLFDKNGSQSSFPLTLEVKPGAPGRVILAFARADVPPIDEGGVVTGLWAQTAVGTTVGQAVGDNGIQSDSWRIGDFVESSAAIRFAPDADPDRAPPAGRFSDILFDTRPPQDLTFASTARFDLTGVEITSTKPGEVRISLGARDLTQLEESVPGYDNVFFAVGVETDDSKTMVGYYRGEAHPSGAWLCAPDTTVFEAQRRDPLTSTWLPILGKIVESAAGGRDGGSAGNAAFLMSVPAACFGLGGHEPTLGITRIAAGSYLIRTGIDPPVGAPVGQTVHEMDAMAPEGGFTLTFATIAEEPPSFWDAPFGLEQFWNIFGAALAVVTVLGTFLVFLRRRGVMKGYIQDIARLEKLHIGEPVARAAALVALRRRLHRDIVRHRVSDSSYLLDRLRSSITSARLVTLGESFYDLPTALALRIERLLDDGRLTMEEQSMLEPLVGRSKMQPPDRDRLIQRLQRWVAEDAGTDS